MDMSWTYEDEEETARWEAAKIKTARMEPPADITGISTETITVGRKKARPRRKARLLEREDWGTLLLLVGLSFLAAFLGGTLSLWIGQWWTW